MPRIPVLDYDAVIGAIDEARAIEAVRAAFAAHHGGEWTMPPKVYVDGSGGDFRAMPAAGGGLAILKWVTSFPANPLRGLPTVTGVVLVSDAADGQPLMMLDARSVTSLRTGAVAAVATRALAPADAASVGVVGCGPNGVAVARSMAVAGYGPGVCCDPREDVALALARQLGWRAGTLAQALACDVVCCVTPGSEVVVEAGDLRPGLHLNMLGADAAGKREASAGAVASCALFCDEWEQASHGGELAGAVGAGLVARGDVTELGAVICGDAPGRPGADAVTLFDSTGLAIQDLAIARLALDTHRAGAVKAQTVAL